MATEGYLSDAAHAAGTKLADALAQARQELAQARKEAEEMSESLKDMADDFRREILQIKGDQAALLELEHKENLQRLEELHQRAGQLGDDEYREALRQANALHELKMWQLKEEANDKESETAGDKTAAGWERAEKAIRGAGEALKEARGEARGVAETDLSGLNDQMNNLANGAERLRSVL